MAEAESQEPPERVRIRQWVYLGPILAAPLAHIAVSSYRLAKSPWAKRAIFFGGVLGATAFSIGMRMVLMVDAGYPAGDQAPAPRVMTVTDAQKDEIQHPTLYAIFRDAFKGFG